MTEETDKLWVIWVEGTMNLRDSDLLEGETPDQAAIRMLKDHNFIAAFADNTGSPDLAEPDDEYNWY